MYDSQSQEIVLIYESMLEEGWKAKAAAVGMGLAALGGMAGYNKASTPNNNGGPRSEQSSNSTTATSEDGKITTSSVKVKQGQNRLSNDINIKKANRQAFNNIADMRDVDTLSGVTYSQHKAADGSLIITATYNDDTAKAIHNTPDIGDQAGSSTQSTTTIGTGWD